ncbi:rRNA maturation RNase YbeY [Rubrolithibacter danxiaensis]|uniref:rRNA maturation RNase YbeY n=1 Tax=Rubrolithibacter danxiaensis TaxID=3390805 RepID=UPI003BF7D716
MSSARIHFFSEEISYSLKQKALLRKWITTAFEEEGKKLKELNFVFCSDNYLLLINQQYLKHNTFTDIITFDNSESPDETTGDIFISIDRVKENSKKFTVPERDELHRVMIHGTLHLLGYKDKSKEDKSLMTEKENYYLSKRNF